MKPIGSIVAWALVAIPLCNADHEHATSFLEPLHKIKAHASTVPSKGDVNPYGVAVVLEESGDLHEGHVLVSNFNNSMNQQGTGIFRPAMAPPSCSRRSTLRSCLDLVPGAWG